jgi:hypothetical protein
MPRSSRDYDSDLDDDPRPRRRRRPRKESGSNIAIILVLVGLGILFLIGVAIGGYVLLRTKPDGIGINSTTVASDEVRLAGQWESTFRDATGQITMRKVKEINGTTETATWYRPDGSVFRVNRVSFQVAMRGQSKVFRYFNGWVVDGPGAGQPFPSGEYIYTLEGDTWTEFGLGGDVIVWTRKR